MSVGVAGDPGRGRIDFITISMSVLLIGEGIFKP